MHIITGKIPGTEMTQSFIVDSVSNCALAIPALHSEEQAEAYLSYVEKHTGGEDPRRLSNETLYRLFYSFFNSELKAQGI